MRITFTISAGVNISANRSPTNHLYLLQCWSDSIAIIHCMIIILWYDSYHTIHIGWVCVPGGYCWRLAGWLAGSFCDLAAGRRQREFYLKYERNPHKVQQRTPLWESHHQNSIKECVLCHTHTVCEYGYSRESIEWLYAYCDCLHTNTHTHTL